MPELNIVLLEPQIPQNTGNISRTCAVIGARLHLIEPMGFKITEKQVKRAGLDYWSKLDLTLYPDIESFYNKNTTGQFFYFSTKARRVYSNVCYGDKVYLVFGREDAGLPEELLKEHADECVRIPMINDSRSLNLSNSVAIGAYEALRQWNFKGFKLSGSLSRLSWD